MMLLRPEGLFPSQRRKRELHTEEDEAFGELGDPMVRRPRMSEPVAVSPRLRTRRTAEILLEARSVTKQFGGLVAVRDINLDIPTGGIVKNIIGPNGAGKTTFFNVIAGIIDPTAGTVAFKGTTLISRPRRVWLQIGPVGRSRRAGYLDHRARVRCGQCGTTGSS